MHYAVKSCHPNCTTALAGNILCSGYETQNPHPKIAKKSDLRMGHPREQHGYEKENSGYVGEVGKDDSSCRVLRYRAGGDFGGGAERSAYAAGATCGTVQVGEDGIGYWRVFRRGRRDTAGDSKRRSDGCTVFGQNDSHVEI